MRDYFGAYKDFQTISKKDSAQLLGADNMIGDVYIIEDELVDGQHRGWLVSRFGKRVGFFDEDFSRELSVMAAQGMICKAILCFVAFSESESKGYYWGNVAVICYNPAYASEFEKFTDGLIQRIGDGIRPAISLEGGSVQQIISSGGDWQPKQTIPMPEKTKGTAVVKSRRSISDKMIEQGRAGNKGCYFVSWIFLLALVALVMFGLYSCVTGSMAG